MRISRTITHLSLSILLCSSLAALASVGGALEQGRAEYAAQNYEEARVLLKQAYAERSTPEAARLLGLIHYHLMDYQSARPLLAEAIVFDPADRELRYALAEVLLGLGDPAAARRQVDILRRSAPQAARIDALAGRVHLALGGDTDAIAAFERARRRDPAEARRIAGDLVRVYARRGRIGEAQEVARETIDAAPDTFEAGEMRAFLQALRSTPKPFTAYLGYQIEHDSNIALEPAGAAVSASSQGKSDLRHVLTADLLGRGRLGRGWEVFGEAHLFQSLHQSLGRFDETRQAYLLGAGWSGTAYGLRVPYEFIGTRLDGDSYLSSHALAPGAFLRLGDVTLYGFARYQKNEFDATASPLEERSGTRISGGGAAFWPFHHERGQLRAIFEAGHDDTDGRNWERDEYRLFLQASYRFWEQLSASLGFERNQHDYDNVHNVFLVRRNDDANTWFGRISYGLDKSWEISVQGVHTQWNSNIAVYEYDRDIVSLGLTWHY